MKSFYVLLVPVLITVVALGTHSFFAYLIRRKEARQEKAKVILLNQLLDVDLDDWYDREFRSI